MEKKVKMKEIKQMREIMQAMIDDICEESDDESTAPDPIPIKRPLATRAVHAPAKVGFLDKYT